MAKGFLYFYRRFPDFVIVRIGKLIGHEEIIGFSSYPINPGILLIFFPWDFGANYSPKPVDFSTRIC
jgi:hypothetical protein